MKLCDRCSVPGCFLNYLGTACKNARQEYCPDVQPNRAELFSNMDINEMAEQFVLMLEELCKDGAPSPEYMKSWLLQEQEK
jgi:hypothetical protein